ncbi:MAG: UvrD-helicase domain-containing protein [Gammaproteobacteria bacterium]|nr:UvrD-helicase domain-containing protein [Gammaproteobacteria bacterium]
MSLSPLTIVPAGAGSGKTYTIQHQLGEWVVQGSVDPERIVAVTFTEAAAAELRERIRTRLLSLGRPEDALKLDEAYIATIHGFGLRLLTEFAFDAGLSPRPRLLNEDEESTLIRLALARTDKADPVTANLARYGYHYDFNSGNSAEEVFRNVLLDVVAKLRAAGWRAESDAYAAQAVEWVRQRYGETEDGAMLTAALRRAVGKLLDAFPDNLARDHGNSQAAFKDLQRDFANLHAARSEERVVSDWKLWGNLRHLRTSNSRTKLPDGYDALAEAVIDAANRLPRHPGPLDQETAHIEALLAAGQDVLVHYARAKREAGLVDYSDMIAMAGDLLRKRPEVRETLAGRIDCLVVDEFQDTNPIQFALLWQLREAGVPALIVGDLKQAIMGFQGADPRLLEALVDQHPDRAAPLDRNWRSQPRLMHFINAVGPGLFGDAYVPLAPQAEDSPLEPLEVVAFPESNRKGWHRIRAAWVGERLKQLLDDPAEQVIDRRTKQPRRLRGGDIAVLGQTHDMLAQYAAVLREQGLPVRLQEEGWFTSRAVQITWYALAYIANPADRHAALYLAVTELGSNSLEQALTALMDDGRIDEPLLTRLNSLAPGVADRTVYALVADTLAALDLFDTVSRWPDGEQARANLLRLQAEAGEFMDANREALASGGYHGAGVQSFLAWLAAKVTRKDKDTQPDPRVIDEDAIELVTWHSAKGREWPVVAVCGLDRDIKPRVPNLALGYTDFNDLAGLLDTARIEYTPDFAAEETKEKFLENLRSEQDTAARRLLYVAMTRPRDKLVLEWPSYLEGKDKLTYWSVLTGRTGLALGDGVMIAGDQSFPCRITLGDKEPPAAPGAEADAIALPVTGRRAIRPGQPPALLTPDSITPSGFDAGQPGTTGHRPAVERYGDSLDLDVGITGADLGTFLHHCFELPSPDADQIDRLARRADAVVERRAAEQIAASAARFYRWLEARFTIQRIERELPLLGLDASGSVVSGTADLVIETVDGVWIIDHKSDRIDDPAAAFEYYLPQLDAYAAVLSDAGKNVQGLGINWVRRAEIAITPA